MVYFNVILINMLYIYTYITLYKLIVYINSGIGYWYYFPYIPFLVAEQHVIPLWLSSWYCCATLFHDSLFACRQKTAQNLWYKKCWRRNDFDD